MPYARKNRPRTTPAPTGLSLEALVASVRLSWAYTNPPFDFTRFDVYRDGVLLDDTTATTYEDATGVDGEDYDYTVVAVRTNPTTLREYASLASNTATGGWVSTASAGIEIVAVTNSTTGVSILVNAVTGADHYRLERSTLPLSGFAQVGSDFAVTTLTDTTGTAGTFYFYRVLPVTSSVAGTASHSRVGTKLGAAGGDAVTLGTLTLTPNFETIHIDLPVTGDTNFTSRAHAEVYDGTRWRHCLPLRRSGGSFIGVARGLTDNTPYTIQVTITDSGGVSGANFVQGSKNTRLDDPPTYAELLAATTHYVDFENGDDARNAATAASALTPWKTYDRAISQANTGAITNATIRVSGYQPAASTQLTAANTRLVATNAATTSASGGRFAPRNDSTAHTVIYGRFLAPAASDLSGDVADTSNNIYGKGGWTTYAPSGRPEWTVWKSPNMGVTKLRQFHYTDAGDYGTYAEAKAADPQRLVYWRLHSTVGQLLNTLDGFCEFVHTNLSMNSGFWMDGSTNFVYALLPNGIDPNDCYCWFSRYEFTENNTVTALDVAASGFVFAGFNVRCVTNGTRVRQGASDGLYMRNLFHGCGAGYYPFKNTDGTGAARITIQDFRITDTNLWNEDASGIPWMIVKQKARKADGTEYPLDPPTDESEVTGIKFNTAGRQFVIRRGDVIGPFNVIGATGSSTAAAAQRDIDFHDMYMSEIADNCIEPEGRSTGWVMWNLTVENVRNFFSTDSDGGVHIFYRASVWQWGNHGLAPDIIGATTDVSKGGVGQLVKFGAGTVGGTLNPTWMMFNVSAWSNIGSSKLWAKAIGAGSQETFVNRNGVYRSPDVVHDNTVSTTGWDNDYNLWGGATKCELRGVQYNSANVTGANTIEAARTATVMGNNDNKHSGTDYNLLGGGLALIDSLISGRLSGDLSLTTPSAGVLLGGLHDDESSVSRGFEDV